MIKQSRGALSPLINNLFPTLRYIVCAAKAGDNLSRVALINE